MKNNKMFMWIFDYYTFETKDIVEIADYTLTMDEETNAKSTINVLKKTTAKARDIIAVKQNNQIIYWGVIDEIQNEDGKQLYTYSTKYITNLFDQKIILDTTETTINETSPIDGLYIIKYSQNTGLVFDVYNLSTENGAKVSIYTQNGGKNQFFGIEKQSNGYYKIMAAHSHKYLTIDTSTSDVMQYEELNNNTQLWEIIKTAPNAYVFKSVYNSKYIQVSTNNYLKVTATSMTSTTIFQLASQSDEKYMQYIGVESFIKRAIQVNFTNNTDTFINLNWLKIQVQSHTPIQTSVSNVDNNIYNLHTWMTNCTQLYNIVYSFDVSSTNLIMKIKVQTYAKELIDTKAQTISNYNEVFETDVVSKVVVLYNKVADVENPGIYTLYLLNDRTTTTDGTDVNRAEGKTETIYTEKYEDANQEALNVMKSNSYNHNITFNLYDKYIPIGTPIAIKTKESLIYDSYISSVKISHNRAYEYICGNIRIKFIEKLLKERN